MDADEAYLRLYKVTVIENVATLAACAAVVLGLFAMGAGGWSLWGLLLMFNLGTVKPPGASK